MMHTFINLLDAELITEPARLKRTSSESLMAAKRKVYLDQLEKMMTNFWETNTY
jgi:hypothetical protein